MVGGVQPTSMELHCCACIAAEGAGGRGRGEEGQTEDGPRACLVGCLKHSNSGWQQLGWQLPGQRHQASSSGAALLASAKMITKLVLMMR